MSDPVLFEEIAGVNNKHIGIATLNVEKSLNALSLDMIGLLQDKLSAWEQDENIACVFLQGAGDKAFCAGGDIRKLYESMKESGDGQNDYAVGFFSQEYRLDYHIHTYAKPIIVWATGIIMGGGMGLCSGASHRVVTETTRMAMPESAIGLYPDVGGTWFLNAAPGRIGLFLGLTGASINASEARMVGLADHIVTHAQKQTILDSLAQLDWASDAQSAGQSASEQVTQLLSGHEIAGPENRIDKNVDALQELTAGASLPDIYQAISDYSGDDEWLQAAAKAIRYACPTSLHLVFEQLQRGKGLSLQEVFQQELIMSVNVARLGNFQEGVRALLIDKDRSPAFKPSTLDEVTSEFIEQHFINPWAEGEHPLATL